MEQDGAGEVVEVHLTPSIDTDPTCLSTLSHIILIMRNLCQLKINRIKVKAFNTKDITPLEMKQILV